METKIYVGNLPYTATEDELRSLFGQAGSVKSVTLIKDRETGRSKGFGFVEMETTAEVEQAVSTLNGTRLNDRELTVSVARPREDRPRSGPGGGRPRSGPGGGGARGGGPRRY